MVTPTSPGWYPDPDGGSADRWWNGVGWSDARRTAAAVVPSVSSVGAAVPSPAPGATAPRVIYSASNPAPQTPAQGGPGDLPGAPIGGGTVPSAITLNTRVNPNAVYGLIAGIIAFFFNVFLVPSIIAIVYSARGLAKANELAAQGETSTMRGAAIGGLSMGILSLFLGVLQAALFVLPFTFAVFFN